MKPWGLARPLRDFGSVQRPEPGDVGTCPLPLLFAEAGSPAAYPEPEVDAGGPRGLARGPSLGQ